LILEDKVKIPISEILKRLHQKFDANLLESEKYCALAERHEANARKLGVTRNFLEKKAKSKHQVEIAAQFDEIFSDSIIALYFAFSGLDIPACMLARRSLELGLVLICYWDKPTDYWAWKSHDDDVSFSKLLAHFSSEGYNSFLIQEGSDATDNFDKVITGLPKLYSKLSNVVHPKTYNFETSGEAAFNISEAELRTTLGRIKEVQDSLLTLLRRRFPEASSLKD
jgi:hypothetical protein